MNSITLTDKFEKAKEFIKLSINKYFDVRLFGCPFALKINKIAINEKVTGPVVVSQFVSIDPVSIEESTITRCASNTEKETVNQTMGSFSVIRYGLYKGFIEVSPSTILKEGNSISKEDIIVLIDSLSKMYGIDRTAARPNLDGVKTLVVISPNKLGGMSRQIKEDLLIVKKITKEIYPNNINDYSITIDEDILDKLITHKFKVFEIDHREENYNEFIM
jgi:Cas7 group CRISPR-associated protein Csh2